MELTYIPKTLEQSFVWLDEHLSNKEDFIKENEDDAVAMGHMGIGRYMRNNWKLWEGTSEISFWFISNGIKHPDDMSGIVMTSYWRFKNDEPINLQEQINYYLNFWEGKDAFPKEERELEIDHIEKYKESNREAYERLINEDIDWLFKQEKTLERDHIMQIVQESIKYYYDENPRYVGRSFEVLDAKVWNGWTGKILSGPEIVRGKKSICGRMQNGYEGNWFLDEIRILDDNRE